MFRLLASHNMRVFIPYACIHPHTSSIVPASNACTSVCFLRSDSIRTSAPQSRLFLVVPGEASPPITEIVIPNSVKSIGEYAFYNCRRSSATASSSSSVTAGPTQFKASHCNSSLNPVRCSCRAGSHVWLHICNVRHSRAARFVSSISSKYYLDTSSQ